MSCRLGVHSWVLDVDGTVFCRNCLLTRPEPEDEFGED